MKNIFITGTDTDVGKTYVALSLIRSFNNQGFSTFGIKPIASGCTRNKKNILVNTDALALQKASSIKRSYEIVNPIALETPIAPHVAAERMGIKLSVADVAEKISSSMQPEADINIIEGAGGWLVPLNKDELISDVISALNLPVILVVGVKLGCLNHAILTTQNIIQKKVPFVGWIANCIDPDALVVEENIRTLQHWIPVPCLGVLPYSLEPLTHATHVKIKSEIILGR